MNLAEVMAGVAAVVAGDHDVEITGLAYDSRGVAAGTLFFCVTGLSRDGHDFAAQAVQGGAVALVVERPMGLGVPEVLVPSARAAMAPAAVRFYGDPTAELEVVGVTGTNGKTTTAFVTRTLLEGAGRRCGLLGTVTAVVGGEQRAVERTTPEAIDLQRLFREMLEAGDRVCAMEVSSHALELSRSDGIRFAAAIFTNLTQDHLDFHGTMEEYFQAKRRLFLSDEGALAPAPGVAIVNVDDPYGARLIGELPGARSFAIDADADYRAVDVRPGLSESRFNVITPDSQLELRSPLPGRFNVYNVLGALAAARELGVTDEQIVAGLPRAARVPGRFEPVDEGQPFAVLVDYAHTPDSLANVLQAARELASGAAAAGRLVCVFGCGGDRDRGKRPQMGAIASELADVVIVTSDNPRSEEPEAIIREILTGAREDVEAIVDRRAAIERAIELAREGDVVVIAGKGHEQGQEFEAGRKLPFDDATVARDALRAAAPASQ